MVISKQNQKEIEYKWHNILMENPTEINYEKAYYELHSFYLKCGDQRTGKSADGTIYHDKLSFITKLFLIFIGSNKKILEVGSGSGLFTRKLAEKNNNVVGIDISKIAINIANKKNKNPQLELTYIHGDARKLHFEDGYFDVAVSIDVVEHLPPQQISNHFQEINRVLKDGGYYLFWTPHKYYGSTSLGMHLKEYTLQEMSVILHASNFRSFVLVGFLNLSLKIKLPILILYEKILFKSNFIKIIKYIKLFKLFIPPICICAYKWKKSNKLYFEKK